MSLDPTQILRPAQGADPVAFAPLGNGRSQAVQRLQIGLFGLAAMVLLVGLANILINNADRNQARVVPEAAPTTATQPKVEQASDPLAEAGVVPDMPSVQEPVQKAQADGAQGGTAPDVP
ncbi:hypothetical protein [Altererythrobacter sp. Root672]|uniref:hypothetical protein n=1 Tax=Altererythrobacter sp. Root672 TaxID=1736584 RepID=UPI0006F20140|nr:hypothetical protein [Altererythrobacter sp. Root672]KRA84265.1 hypothetical protein ASD76_09870 [Altererythrobacter sp. Root672]